MFSIKNIENNVCLSPHTTYKIGGPADYFLITKTKAELISAIIEARIKNIPYFILGKGANILFGDKGFRGLVIKNETNNIKIEGNLVTADSGVTIENLITISKDKNLSGLEHFAGIPSTVGGALWQNLHFLSPDRSKTIFIESMLDSAEILDEKNNIQKVNKDFFKFDYDFSILHNQNIIVTEATFILEHKDKNFIQKQIDENLKWREEKHPDWRIFPSCGSVFKKIEGFGAGRLIEKVGLKGYKIGEAQISDKHANFIINTGQAQASDVVSLINLIKYTVNQETGLTLETEINFVGEF